MQPNTALIPEPAQFVHESFAPRPVRGDPGEKIGKNSFLLNLHQHVEQVMRDAHAVMAGVTHTDLADCLLVFSVRMSANPVQRYMGRQ